MTRPPTLNNQEAEEATIGSVLIDPGCFDQLAKILKPEDFYLHKLRWIWQAFISLKQNGGATNSITISDELQRSGKLDELGGDAYLTKLISLCPDSSQGESFAGIVSDNAMRRRQVAQASELARQAYDLKTPLRVTRADTKISTMADLSGVANITWAWKSWLPNGFLTILAGDSGIGKSGLALRICGSFICEKPWPDGTEFTGEAGSVLWCECEAFQVAHYERATSWGYPVEKIVFPLGPLDDVSLDNENHRAAIEEKSKLPEIKFIVVDSLSGSSHRKENDTEIKIVNEFLSRLARNSQKPVLITHHLRKKTMLDGDEVTPERLRGSSAIIQAGRVIWAIDIPNPENKELRRFSQIKNNLIGRRPDPFGVSFTNDGPVFGIAPKPPHQETKLEQAVDLLMALLAPQPQKATYVENEFTQAGFSRNMMLSAKEHLKVVAIRKNNHWMWSLPSKS